MKSKLTEGLLKYYVELFPNIKKDGKVPAPPVSEGRCAWIDFEAARAKAAAKLRRVVRPSAWTPKNGTGQRFTAAALRVDPRTAR